MIQLPANEGTGSHTEACRAARSEPAATVTDRGTRRVTPLIDLGSQIHRERAVPVMDGEYRSDSRDGFGITDKRRRKGGTGENQTEVGDEIYWRDIRSMRAGRRWREMGR